MNGLPMTSKEFEAFLERHDISDVQASRLFAVSPVAIYYWLKGKRSMAPGTSKLVRFLDKHPEMIGEYEQT